MKYVDVVFSIPVAESDLDYDKEVTWSASVSERKEKAITQKVKSTFRGARVVPFDTTYDFRAD